MKKKKPKRRKVRNPFLLQSINRKAGLHNDKRKTKKAEQKLQLIEEKEADE